MDKELLNSFTSFKGITQHHGKDLYPCTVHYFSLMDCHPTNEYPSYQITDHSDNDEYVDSHDDDDVLEIYIPDRKAAFELIRDINERINSEINAYRNCSMPCAPLDDSTSDIFNAIDLCYLLIHYDQD